MRGKTWTRRNFFPEYTEAVLETERAMTLMKTSQSPCEKAPQSHIQRGEYPVERSRSLSTFASMQHKKGCSLKASAASEADPSGKLEGSAHCGLVPTASTTHDEWPQHIPAHHSPPAFTLDSCSTGRQMRSRETQPSVGTLRLYLHVCFLLQGHASPLFRRLSGF